MLIPLFSVLISGVILKIRKKTIKYIILSIIFFGIFSPMLFNNIELNYINYSNNTNLISGFFWFDKSPYNLINNKFELGLDNSRLNNHKYNTQFKLLTKRITSNSSFNSIKILDLSHPIYNPQILFYSLILNKLDKINYFNIEDVNLTKDTFKSFNYVILTNSSKVPPNINREYLPHDIKNNSRIFDFLNSGIFNLDSEFRGLNGVKILLFKNKNI